MSNTILQPVKIESNVNTSQTKASTTTPTLSSSEVRTTFAKSSSSNSLPHTSQSPSINNTPVTTTTVNSTNSIDPSQVKNLASAMDEIDLSYFEKSKSESKLNGLSGKSSKPSIKINDSSGVVAPEKSKNKYLDQLLKDIYSNDVDKSSSNNKPAMNSSNETASNKKEEDIFSDKKCNYFDSRHSKTSISWSLFSILNILFV